MFRQLPEHRQTLKAGKLPQARIEEIDSNTSLRGLFHKKHWFGFKLIFHVMPDLPKMDGLPQEP